MDFFSPLALPSTNTQKLYKTKCTIRKFQPIINMKEIKSLTKNLELHIHQWNKHVQNRAIMIHSFKIKAQRFLLRKKFVGRRIPKPQLIPLLSSTHLPPSPNLIPKRINDIFRQKPTHKLRVIFIEGLWIIPG